MTDTARRLYISKSELGVFEFYFDAKNTPENLDKCSKGATPKSFYF